MSEQEPSKRGKRAAGSDPWGEPTRWTVVLKAAGRVPSPNADKSWMELVERYREPIKESVRILLRSSSEAEQVADDFFTYLYDKGILPKIDPERGKFRAYIQGVLRRYVKWDQRNARIQRGPEEEFDIAAPMEDPEVELEEERAWARRVFDLALERLTKEMPRDAEILLQASGIHLPGSPGKESSGAVPKMGRKALAEKYGIQPNAIDQANFRARRKLRDLIRSELRETVATSGDLDEEFALVENRFLAAHLGRS
ncbi:MAG: RNA polymerase sigma factor [Planctomycetota bacterium]